MQTIQANNQSVLNSLKLRKDRGAWDNGVTRYAIDMVESAEETLNRENCRQVLLNGASDWSQYSYGGCALIYDADIAEQLCSPSELKKTRNGDRQPNGRESWLDVQTRALSQAYARIKRNLPL